MALRTATTISLQIEKVEFEFLNGKRKRLGDNYVRLNRLRRQSLNLGLYGKPFGDDGEEDLDQYLQTLSKQKSNPRKGVLLQERA